MSELEELKIRIVSVIGSEKNGCTDKDLCRIYRDLYGKDLLAKSYGYEDVKSLLNAAFMQGPGGILTSNGRYYAAGDRNTIKMLDLVRNTREKKKSRRSKASGYLNRTNPPAANFRMPSIAVSKETFLKPQTAARSPTSLKQQIQSKVQVQKASSAAEYVSLKNNCMQPIGKSLSSAISSNRQTERTRSSKNSHAYSARFSMFRQDLDKLPARHTHDYVYKLTAPGMHENLCESSFAKNRPKKQKGRKRFEKLIDQCGGEISYSKLRDVYEHQNKIPLNNEELCRLFEATEEEVENLYEFFVSRFENYIQVKKLHDGDLLLSVEDDYYHDDNSEEYENLSVVDMSLQKISLSTDNYSPPDFEQDHPSIFSNDSTENFFTNEQPYDHRIDDRLSCRLAMATSAMKLQDDCLSYKVLGDKLLSFVRVRGSVMVQDLSRIFYEEDGRNIDPKNYAEGTWESVVRKVLSNGGYPDLILSDGILGFRQHVQEPNTSGNVLSVTLENSACKKYSCISDNSVPIGVIYDILKQEQKPLSQKLLLERLTALDYDVNVCHLTMMLMIKFKDVFRCKFDVGGLLLSLEPGAKRPAEACSSHYSVLFEKLITTSNHVMSDYCSALDSADTLFKPVILLNIALVKEETDSFRIQVSFRLCCYEKDYQFFQEEIYSYCQQYVKNESEYVKEPVEGEIYVFHDPTKESAFRVQCLSNGCSTALAVPVYLIDELRYEEIPVCSLRKVTGNFAKQAYGVVAQTAPFRITTGKENEFYESFSNIRMKLLYDTKEEIKVYIDSKPSTKLFELKQLYTEAHDGLGVPKNFIREKLIKIRSLKPSGS